MRLPGYCPLLHNWLYTVAVCNCIRPRLWQSRTCGLFCPCDSICMHNALSSTSDLKRIAFAITLGFFSKPNLYFGQFSVSLHCLRLRRNVCRPNQTKSPFVQQRFSFDKFRFQETNASTFCYPVVQKEKWFCFRVTQGLMFAVVCSATAADKIRPSNNWTCISHM